MMENQLAGLRESGSGDEETATLETEIANLEEDSGRLPWQDGLPPAIAEALAPYREDLDTVHCKATGPLELMLNEKRGPGLETR